MISFVKNNLEILAFLISIFTSVMLVWSNFETRKSRMLQYMPYIRTSLNPSFLIFHSENTIDKDFYTYDLIKSQFERDSNKIILSIINDGVGIAKNLKLIMDYRKVFQALETDLQSESYYLKPLFDSYELKSFHLNIYEFFNMKITFWASLVNLKVAILNKYNIKFFSRTMSSKESLIYREYYNEVIQPNSVNEVPFTQIFDEIGIVNLYKNQNGYKFTKFEVPLCIEYYDLEGRRNREYATLFCAQHLNSYGNSIYGEKSKEMKDEMKKIVQDNEPRIIYTIENVYFFKKL